jgi:hypothetical protein
MNFSTEHSILSKFYLEETDAGKSLQLDSFMKLFLAYLARKKYVWDFVDYGLQKCYIFQFYRF